MAFKVDAKGEINFTQFLRQGENQAELAGKGVVLVGQDRYGKIMFLRHLSGKLRP